MAPDLLVFAISHYRPIVPLSSLWTASAPPGTSIQQDAWYRIANSAGAQQAQTSYTNE
jgi:hypothetical protein